MSLEELLPPNQQKYANIIMLRSSLVVSTLLIALSVPFFGLVMALVGSLLTMLVTYILPCACFLAILKRKVTWHQIAACSFIIVVGVCCACVGTYSSLSKIIQNYTWPEWPAEERSTSCLCSNKKIINHPSIALHIPEQSFARELESTWSIIYV